MVLGWQVLHGALLGWVYSPNQNMGPQKTKGQGLGWVLLLDDGGQLCAKVLAVEPLLKQDICGVSHVVPVRAKDGQPSSPSGRPHGSLAWAWLCMGKFGPGWPCRAGLAELAACFTLLAQPSGHS